MAAKKGRELTGGAAPKVKTARANSWTNARETRFLETLAETCNVTLAKGAAGMSSTAVYRRRRHDASFRRAWGEAIAVGYAELEMMLLRRALNGVERTIKGPDGEPAVMTEYNDRTALALLKQHRDTAVEAETEISSEAHEEACERILAKLQRLRERKRAAAAGRDGGAVAGSDNGAVAGSDNGAVAVKGFVDRLTVIAEALAWSRGARR